MLALGYWQVSFNVIGSYLRQKMASLDGTVMEEKEDDLFSETSSIGSLHSAMASSSVHTRSTA